MKNFLNVLVSLLFVLFFAGCGEQMFYSKYDYFPKNSEKLIKELPIFEDNYYEYNTSKDISEQDIKDTKTVFSLKKIYNKNNSHIQITFFEDNKKTIENRNFFKLYNKFYLTKKYDTTDKMFIYSVVKIDNGIITPIDIKNDEIQLIPGHKDHFDFDLVKTTNYHAKDENSLLIKDKNFNNFKKYLTKSIMHSNYKKDEYQYYISFKTKNNDKKNILNAIKKNGMNLKIADKNLKKDKEVVLAAVKENPDAFKYADESLKKDKKFILDAIKESADAFKYIDKTLKSNKKFILDAVNENSAIIEYLDDSTILSLFKHLTLNTIDNKQINININSSGLSIDELKNRTIVFYFINQLIDKRPEIKLLKRLKEQYRDNMEIICIGLQEGFSDSTKLKELMKKYNTSFLAVKAFDNGKVSDVDKFVYILKKFGVIELWAPQLFIVGKDGVPLKTYKGMGVFKEKELKEIQNTIENDIKK